MIYNMTNYLDFLTALWKITKEDGGFKAYSALISKYGVNKSISVVLCDDLEWVSDEGSLYMWQGKKPTKKDAETVYLMLKNRLDKQKKEKAKRDAAEISKYASGKGKTIVYKTSKTNNLVNELSELGKAISNVNNNTGEIVIDKAKVPYDDVELNKDVKEILQVTAEEVAISKRLYDLQEDYAKSQLQLETERKISFDEIDRLSTANQALENQIINLTNINSEHRQQILADGENIISLQNRLTQAVERLDISNNTVIDLTAKLKEANKKIESTLKYKIQSWFRR